MNESDQIKTAVSARKEELEQRMLELEIEIKKKELAATAKETNWFQIGVAAAGVFVTGLLGYGQWRMSAQQNRIMAEQHRAEERRASDNVEVQVIALVAPRFSELGGSDEKAKTSQRVVLAAASYLTDQYQRTGLAKIYREILPPSADLNIQVGAAEATEPATAESPWHVVLASLAANDKSAACKMAHEKLKIAQSEGLPEKIRLYRTKISDNYAVVIGEPMSRLDAVSLAVSARNKGLAEDTFAQQDRSWTLASCP